MRACVHLSVCLSVCLTFVSLQLFAHHWFLPSVEADNLKDE